MHLLLILNQRVLIYDGSGADILKINEQIVLYVLSRTLVSLLPRLYNTSPNPPSLPFSPLHPLPPVTSREANPGPVPVAPLPFAILAAASWAGVMYMFRHRGERIQAGMGNSMRESSSFPAVDIERCDRGTRHERRERTRKVVSGIGGVLLTV